MKQFKLDDTPKIKPGFITPEGYFDGFTERLMEQLPAQEVKVVPLYRRTPVWMSAAAAVFTVMFGAGIYYSTYNHTPAQPDDAAIENYIVYQTNMSTYDLMQDLDQQDIAELESSMMVSDEAIEDYLLNHNFYIND